MKFNYDTLAPREQQLVKYGAIALVVVLIFGVLMPLDSSVSKARTRITKKQQDLVWMKGVAPFLAAQAPVNHGNGESLIVIVDRSARESGLGKSLAGTDPSGGAGGIQVRLEKAPFDAVIGWLSRLSQQN